MNMLFERLLVQNLGVFRGEHFLDLVPADPHKPIVLVGALNGSGKTTIIEALQLALYGKRAGYGWRGAGAYAQYLTQLRNRNATPSEPTVSEVAIKLADGRRLRVRRQWSFLKETPREYVSVFVNDAELPDLSLSEGWDDEVERLLPVRLSELFFFDGERIEKLADPAKSGDVLRTAVASLMGLDQVDHLVTDLEILRGRLRQKLLQESDNTRFVKLESEYRLLRQSLEDLRQSRAQVKSRLVHARSSFEESQKTLRSKGGDRFKQREQVSEERSRVSAELGATLERQRQVAAGHLPLILVRDSLLRLQRQAREGSANGGADAAEAIRTEWKLFLQWLKGRGFAAKSQKELHTFVAKRLQETSDRDNGSQSCDWKQATLHLAAVLGDRLASAQQLAQELISSEAILSEKCLGLEERLKLMPELEQLAIGLRESGMAEEVVRGLESQDQALEKAENERTRELRELERTREAILQMVVKSGDAARAANYCQRSISTLMAFRQGLVEKRRRQLERLVLEAFQTLVRKTDLVGDLTIDPDTMVVSLLGSDGKSVAAQQLSAGERQLLAIAILWGLARASGRPVPVVIDTPLGRLDGEHRKALIERYFPDASHQVILLSTDQEVDAEFSTLLDDSVGHRYLIGYNAAEKSSSFSPGYFQS